MEEILLSKAEVNKAYVINEILLDDIKIARRLSELGFYSGAQIKILAISSLKKVFLIEIQNYVLCLRATVCNLIKVVDYEYKKN